MCAQLLLVVALRGLDHPHIRDTALVHTVLREVVDVPVVVQVRLHRVHGGLNWRVAVQRELYPDVVDEEVREKGKEGWDELRTLWSIRHGIY